MRLLLLFVFLFSSAVLSQNRPDPAIIQGMKYADNLQFKKADSLFYLVVKKNKNLPDGYYFISQIYFWKYLANRDSANYLVYLKFVNIADSLAQSLNLENSAWENFVVGSIHATKAAALSTFGKNLDALFETKKAFSFFEKAIELDSTFADPYYGLGVFNYALSFLPPVFRLALDIIGLSHNKNRAISYLKKSFEQGILTSNESGFNLSKIYLEYLGELDSAEYFINKVLEKNNRNILFLYQFGLIQIRKKNLAGATKILKSIVNKNENNFRQTKALSYFLLGEINFLKNNFRKAIKYYQNFFNYSETIDYIGYASLKLALAAKFIGSNKLYVQNITTTNFGNDKIPEDIFAAKLGRLLLKKGLNKGMLNVIKAENYFNAGNYSRGIKFCDSVLLKIYSNKHFNEIKILKAAMLTAQHKYLLSNKLLEKAGPIDFLKELLFPLKLITLVKNYLGTKKFNMAKVYYDKLKSIKLGLFKNKYEGEINFLGRHYLK